MPITFDRETADHSIDGLKSRMRRNDLRVSDLASALEYMARIEHERDTALRLLAIEQDRVTMARHALGEG